MTTELEVLAAEVAGEQAALDDQSKDTRTRVLRMGRLLRQMKKVQKKQQAETGETWTEWCAEQKCSRGTFPSQVSVTRYMRISEYPQAYEPGMSIKEAHKNAVAWKNNGGQPPATKKTIKARPLITIGVAAGKLELKIEKLAEANLAELATEQSWTDDEQVATVEALTLLRQSCNLLIRKLRELMEQEA